MPLNPVPNYPASLDSLPDPTSATYEDDDGFEIDLLLQKQNAILEALESAVGTTPGASDLLTYLRLYDGTSKGLYVPAASLLGLNPILNASFDIWQDGATFTSIADGVWGPDGWLYVKIGAGVHDLLRSTDVPTVAQAQRVTYSLQLDVTTVDASIAAGDVYVICTRIEGYNFKRLDQKAWALRFWVKAAKTGVHYVSAANSAGDRSCVVAYTVNVADTWEEKQVAFPANPSAGTWDFANGRGLQIGWCLAAGSTFQTTAGAWQTGNFFCASDQVNELDNTVNNFRIALVGRPTLGTNALPFQPVDIQTEVLRARRYNEPLGGVAGADPIGAGAWYAATTGWAVVDMVAKRANPVLAISASGDFQALTATGGVAAVTTGPALATFLGGAGTTLSKFIASWTCSGATATAGQGTALLSANTNARFKLTSRIP